MLTMKLTSLKALFLSVSIITLSACGGGSSNSTESPQLPDPDTDSVDYQQLIDDTVSSDIPGIILEITTPEFSFIGASGVADTETQESMQTYHKMPAGSAGKKAITLLIAMMHSQGQLNIDDTIDTWLAPELLSQIEYSDQMTLRQLLNHTAGVYDYLDDDTSDEWFDTAFTDIDTLKTDSYALQFALNKPAYFEPGNGFKYSNTGYLLAGLILDEILGEHHHTALRNEVLLPLGLNDTYYGGVEKHLGEIISGYVLTDTGALNSKPFYTNIGVADAPLVSTVQDMTTLLKSIITDNSVVNDDMRDLLLGDESLIDIGDDVSYGLGIFKDIINGQTVYHHGGDEAGYKSTNLYIDELDSSVTVFFNCNGYAECVEPSDQLVQQILSTLLPQ